MISTSLKVNFTRFYFSYCFCNIPPLYCPDFEVCIKTLGQKTRTLKHQLYPITLCHMIITQYQSIHLYFDIYSSKTNVYVLTSSLSFLFFSSAETSAAKNGFYSFTNTCEVMIPFPLTIWFAFLWIKLLKRKNQYQQEKE